MSCVRSASCCVQAQEYQSRAPRPFRRGDECTHEVGLFARHADVEREMRVRVADRSLELVDRQVAQVADSFVERLCGRPSRVSTSDTKPEGMAGTYDGVGRHGVVNLEALVLELEVGERRGRAASLAKERGA